MPDDASRPRADGERNASLSEHDERLCAQAEELATSLLQEALASIDGAERRRRARVARLVDDEDSRELLLALTDQVLRIGTRRRAASRLEELLAAHRAPAMAGPLDRVALFLARRAARVVPDLTVRLVTARLRHELETLVLPAEPRPLSRHLQRRRREGMRCNVNLLGEAVLGEGQAARRSRMIQALVELPDVECVSVKLSALDSQLDVLSYDQSRERVLTRLRPLVEAAARHRPVKLVNLDMEEYRDLHITVDTFLALGEEPELLDVTIGVAIQAYLPDSVGVLEQICASARKRRDAGGAPLRVRLVKGANLAMERVEAELRGWPLAPFESKELVDANYKRLLDIALASENAGALKVGVASHNLFDVAWAIVVGRERGGDRVEIEMLEGMASPEAKAVARVTGGVLVYLPVVERGDFESAVAYLVRRFDENTAPENFLARLASLRPGSDAWEDQRLRFRAAVAHRHDPAPPSRRVTAAVARREGSEVSGFSNAADTDFSVVYNRSAVLDALAKLRQPLRSPVAAIVGAERVEVPAEGIGRDPSHPEVEWYRYVTSTPETVERAVAVARRAGSSWAATPVAERRRILRAVAERMEADRFRTIATMVRDAGKIVREADSEVSEAVDDARYYAELAVELPTHFGPHGTFEPYGVVVVAPPWNFPYAIPAGGVLAALAAGNAVILKPAPETVLTGALLVSQCHEAGVPAEVLQFVPCADDDAGRRLVTHPDVGAVVLTGAFDTARTFLQWRPDMGLHAETSGKNAYVVSAAADQEDAVRDLVHSAFSHAGQKCSAASLAIVEAPVYDDQRFRQRLADAVASLRVGPAEDPATAVGPLIRPPAGPLRRALTTLTPGEEWLVEPRQKPENPQLWSPGVKLGVAPTSFFHLTECFGPVLGVMRAKDLEEAVRLQNGTQYGLTGGLASLDEREVRFWERHVQVGNAYVNRHITGAIVRRQPFGGWKRSSVGSDAKAGGPNYVASFGRWQRSSGAPLELAFELEAVRVAADRLLRGVDESGLAAESNVFRLAPLRRAVLRLGTAPDAQVLELSLLVAGHLGVDVEVSAPPEVSERLAGAVRQESDEEFVRRMHAQRPERVRLVGCTPQLRLALLDACLELDVEPLVALGRYEMLRWAHEKAISTTRHRHGNVLRSASASRRDDSRPGRVDLAGGREGAHSPTRSGH